MSEQDAALPPRRGDWWSQPRVVLPLAAVLMLLLAIVTPQPSSSGRLGDPRLSAHLAGSLGAKLLAETAERLGWQVVLDDTTRVPARLAGRTVRAVLAPRFEPTPAEAHAVLDAVRAGDGLLLVIEGRGALADSLGVATRSGDWIFRAPTSDVRTCGPTRDFVAPLWSDSRVHLLALAWRGAPPIDVVRFAPLGASEHAPRAREGQVRDAAAGIAFGRGRVVIVSDPDLLRNDVLRRCDWGADVAAVRMLEWLRAGGDEPRAVLAFDEFHQGFGPHPSTLGVTRDFLWRHPVGRSILAVVIAALLLLWARAPRALPPSDVDHIQRRDPLEQVDALAHAYEQVRGTRTVVATLLHGLRGRVERGGLSRSRSDDEFLAAVVERDPERSADVELVRHGLGHTISDRDLLAGSDALRRMEASLTTTLA
jgi:hypothetical protein